MHVIYFKLMLGMDFRHGTFDITSLRQMRNVWTPQMLQEFNWNVIGEVVALGKSLWVLGNWSCSTNLVWENTLEKKNWFEILHHNSSLFHPSFGSRHIFSYLTNELQSDSSSFRKWDYPLSYHISLVLVLFFKIFLYFSLPHHDSNKFTNLEISIISLNLILAILYRVE